MIYIVAFNYQQAHFYCRFVADPPINPYGHHVCILSTSDPLRPVKGRYITNKDTLVWYGPYYEGKSSTEIERSLHPCITGTPTEVFA